MQDLRPLPSLAAKDWLTAINRLEAQGVAYALVTVLRVEPPASARAGDKAVLTRTGELFGWIGGGCAQPVVRKAIDEALDSGTPMTIRITPSAEETSLEGIRQVPMACHSGGSVELFIEPHQPAVPLYVVGQAPVAQVLRDLASRVGIPVVSVSSSSAHPSAITWAVVATQGQGDGGAIRHALQAQARQVWFIASARKWSKLRLELSASGVPEEDLARVTAPAGIPIGAKTPEEIALSVLAAVVAARRSAEWSSQDGPVATQRSPSVTQTPSPVTTPKTCCGGGG